ncbi:MAG: PhoH family protein [Anaerolineae bacterium]|nr:PhoH family protein [Anaerolineae bacterium]
MAELNKTIEALTKDQYQVIQLLQGHRRVAIAGCAGSGKTLIAVEKAIRLDKAGLRTLILCHNPYLAGHLSHLTAGTGIDVFDFGLWIAQLLEAGPDHENTWTRYEEPTEQELENAFDRLTASGNKYDAVIVDEGQDFRDTWWLVVEAALTDPQTGILYIFFDDNQALLPGRSKYPIPQALFTLSKNCRNAGKIFELVQRFHPQAPEPSVWLVKQGVYQHSTFLPGEEIGLVRNVVGEALRYFSPEQLVVLTAESVSIEENILNELEVWEKPKWKWQEVVIDYLNSQISQRIFGKNKSSVPKVELSDLSQSSYPTLEDIEVVRNEARRILLSVYRHDSPQIPVLTSQTQVYSRMIKWNVTEGGNLFLSNTNKFPRPIILAFFHSKNWADSLPKLKSTKIMAKPQGEFALRLHTVESYKGLEADGIIFFVRSFHDNLAANLYVGISRARFFLHIVISSEVLARIPQLTSS